jgi:hypothetical protein
MSRSYLAVVEGPPSRSPSLYVQEYVTRGAEYVTRGAE